MSTAGSTRAETGEKKEAALSLTGLFTDGGIKSSPELSDFVDEN
jgi:hypothetical protein